MFQLVDLLQHGDISPLSFGANRQFAAQALGDPEGEYVSGDTVVEKRGPIQLTFSGDQLHIWSWLLLDPTPPPIDFAGQLPTSATSLNLFLDLCDQLAVAWRIEEKLTFNRQLTIRTCDRLLAFFDLDARDLQKIIVSAT
ncbi:hypothetical protein [Blastopirellula marina]|uniref:Uncharacterized protein n=1 Tax=Blastopirellula marina TaxID=124 RepID=A0A2S8GU67_9BACT|nr:hypothetical protein [Blastopirellula marina]PQO47921.1 hypothetical protein C5Y93_00610 [Blastopirellula marina]